MRIYILVIVAQPEVHRTGGQSDVRTGCPDPDAQIQSLPQSRKERDDLVQKRIVCINSTALSHCHMMWRVKAGGSDITDRSGQFLLTVNRIDRTECIAVILDQPQVMSITELFYCLQVKWISKCMCEHDSFCLRRPCSFQKGKDQCCTVEWSHRQIPVRPHTGSSEKPLSGNLPQP